MEKETIYNEDIILFKYGGNAMIDDNLKQQVLQNICSLKDKNKKIIIVHGGGPFIKQALKEAKIESEFIDGHRKTTPEAYEYVEMALKGKVNGSLVSLINSIGYKAVGLSGKDGQMVVASKRLHKRTVSGKTHEIDLGQVGDVVQVNTDLLSLLLDNNFIPVITCLADDKVGNGYNINADMFAGYIAGELKASQYIVLTDVDGLLLDRTNPESLIQKISLTDINKMIENKTIEGGMIPKIESCEIAINKGAKSARIINGTVPDQILKTVDNSLIGTLITK